jgi:heme-degrading monooxygenase HmoA
MHEFFTHGRWLVREGREAEFVQEWERLASWATGAVPGGPWAVLLRDRENRSQFVSFGPWESLDAVADFRGRPEFQEALGRMRPLLSSVETYTLDRVVSGGEI